MSPTERLLWLRIQRRVRAAEPRLRAALLSAYRRLARTLPEAELLRLLRSASPDRLVSALLDDAVLVDVLTPVRETLRSEVSQAATAFSRDLPKAARGIGFNILNPSIVTAIRTMETRVLTRLADDLRATVRAFVEAGLRDGLAPASIARGLRQVLPLAPSQLGAVQNFERLLRAGSAEALTRQLRDRRFDGTVRRAFAGDGLSEAQIGRMVGAYRQRMVAHNATTQARTMVLEAQKLGQRLTWEQAIANGFVDGTLLMQRWSGTLDERERDSHLVMEGETVGWNEPFSNGQMYPGEGEYNCRCVAMFFSAQNPVEAARPSAGARGITADQLRGRGARAA